MAKAAKNTENTVQSALDILLQDRSELLAAIQEIEAKDKPSSVEKFAVEGMRSKLGELSNQIGPQIEASIIGRLFDAAVLATSLVSEDLEFVVSLKGDGSDPEVSPLRGRKARRNAGETQTKRKFGWEIDGKGLKEGAGEILKDLASKITLVMGEYKKDDVRGVCARKGWKIAPEIGPVSQHMQGKKTASGYVPSVVKLSSGQEIELIDSGDKSGRMYATRRALRALAKDRDSEAVKDAVSFMRDLLADELKADGIASGNKKVSANDLIAYIREQQKIADQSNAEVIA